VISKITVNHVKRKIPKVQRHDAAVLDQGLEEPNFYEDQGHDAKKKKKKHRRV
jgi:hypothetical protein